MDRSHKRRSGGSRRTIVRRVLLSAVGGLVGLAVAGFVVYQVSPWPSALIIRRGFDQEGKKVSEALSRHVPSGVAARLNEHYDLNDGDAYLDVYYPTELDNTDRTLPTVVWIHGGAWVSGSKDLIANYLKIVAARGYTVIGVGYSIAPGKTYPTPLIQVNKALAYLNSNAQRLHIDASRLVLAGDSAGSQIAAQVANIISVPSYAKSVGIEPTIGREQLAGVMLYCGAYDMKLINVNGEFGGFLKSVLWAYTGTKDFKNDSRTAHASVLNYVTPTFPAMFISAGNDDPLLPQSRAFADAVASKGVPVDSLFYPDDYTPALPHEYQFNLDAEAGNLALERSIAFLAERTKP